MTPIACAAAWAALGSSASSSRWRAGALGDSEEAIVASPASAVASAARLRVPDALQGDCHAAMNRLLALEPQAQLSGVRGLHWAAREGVEHRLGDHVVARRARMVVVADGRVAAGPRPAADPLHRQRDAAVAGQGALRP